MTDHCSIPNLKSETRNLKSHPPFLTSSPIRGHHLLPLTSGLQKRLHDVADGPGTADMLRHEVRCRLDPGGGGRHRDRQTRTTVNRKVGQVVADVADSGGVDAIRREEALKCRELVIRSLVDRVCLQ